jgi:hypothetical protein
MEMNDMSFKSCRSMVKSMEMNDMSFKSMLQHDLIHGDERYIAQNAGLPR